MAFQTLLCVENETSRQAGLVYAISLSLPISRPQFPKQTKKKRDRFTLLVHVQITETIRFQLEAKGKAVLVLQELGACPVPST